MSKPRIRRLTRDDKDFYPLLGPFLANRAVVAQVGDHIWDDQGKAWFVATDRRHTPVGFVGVIQRGRRWIVESLYLDDDAHAEVALALLNRVVEEFGDHDLHAMVRHPAAPMHQQAGFVEDPAKTTQRFTSLVRPAA